MKGNAIKILVLAIGLILLNVLAGSFYKRFDLTKDKRYTLSVTTEEIVNKLDRNAIITVYLEGDFPPEFKRLQTETRQHLEELASLNKHIKFRFVNRLDGDTQALIEQGLEPSRLSVQEDGKVSEAVIFPWAAIEYGDKKQNIPLLTSNTAGSQEEQLQQSIENLEYAFSNAIHNVTKSDKQKIAIIKGNGELDDAHITGFGMELREYYNLAPFTLDSVSVNPQKTLKQLLDYDLALIAKPNERFTEEEKFTLDQYIANGGKTLWLIDNVSAELDSLMETGQSIALNKDLNLTDQLFSYGIRINYNLVRDIDAAMIRLASGNVGGKTQYQDFLWPYYPLVKSKNNHPINKNIDPVLLKFVSTIDTLKNKITKTVLLESSQYSKPVGTPVVISLEEVAKRPEPIDYNQGNQLLGVLLEGEFTSVYANRVKPYKANDYKENSMPNKMVVIADGDVIANELFQGQPMALGVDKWTNIRYGNSTFLMNAVNYLLDDSGLLKLRSKTVQLQFLDKQKAYKERTFWKLLNVVLPLILLALFGIIYTFIRKKRYS